MMSKPPHVAIAKSSRLNRLIMTMISESSYPDCKSTRKIAPQGYCYRSCWSIWPRVKLDEFRGGINCETEIFCHRGCFENVSIDDFDVSKANINYRRFVLSLKSSGAPAEKHKARLIARS